MAATSSIRHWILPLAITLACVVIASTEEADRLALQYLGPGPELQHGDISYRWITGHFTHMGWRHVALNLLGLISVWALYSRAISKRAWLLFLLICPIGISLGFSLLSPQIAYYVGLSGVLHGMLAAAATASLLIPNERASAHKFKWEEALVLAGLWAKIAYEQTVGAVPMTAALAGGGVVVNAHLYGATIGTGFAAALYGYQSVKCKICKYINLPDSDY